MKKILLIASLLLIAAFSKGQTYCELTPKDTGCMQDMIGVEDSNCMGGVKIMTIQQFVSFYQRRFKAFGMQYADTNTLIATYNYVLTHIHDTVFNYFQKKDSNTRSNPITPYYTYLHLISYSDTAGSTAGGLLTSTKVATIFSVANVMKNYNWLLLGNANTNPRKNFVGTDDNVGLTFRTDSVPVAHFDTAAIRNMYIYGNIKPRGLIEPYNGVAYQQGSTNNILSYNGSYDVWIPRTVIQNGTNTTVSRSLDGAGDTVISINASGGGTDSAVMPGYGMLKTISGTVITLKEDSAKYATVASLNKQGAGLFKNISITNKSPYYPDTNINLRYGGTGYQTTQSKYIPANFYNAKQKQWAGGVSQIKWAFFGDSYSEIIYQYMPKVFQNICGAGPVSGYSGAFGTGAGLGVTGNVGKADTGVIDQIMRFKEISGGNTIEISKGGVGHFGLGGTAFTATKITVAYITQPLGGTIKMQVNNGTYVAINTFSATIGIGFYTFRQAATSSTLRILNSSTSKDSDEIAFIGMEDTLVNGLTVFHLGVGGISLDSCVAGNITGTQNLATFMNYENPTVWTAEMKEDTLYASGRTYRQDLDTFYTRMTFRDTGLRHADVFLYGSPPISTGGNEQYVQNQMVQSICLLFGFNYYDTYALWGGYAKLVQDGMQGDGTHVNATANIYRGWKFLRDCGFLYNMSANLTGIDSVHFSSILQVGTPYNGYASPALVITNNGLDPTFTSARDIFINTGAARKIGINQASPAYTLDLTGTFNASTSINTPGTVTCNLVSAASASSTFGNGTVVTSAGNTQFTVQRTGGSASSIALWAFGSQPYIVYTNNLDFYNGSVITDQFTSTGDLKIGGSGAGNTGSLQTYYSGAYQVGTTGQALCSQGSGVAPQWTTIANVNASADLTAQSAAATVTTFTTTSTGTFRIGGYINVTAVSVDVIEMQVTYTDENNTSQTMTMNTNGLAQTISATGNNPLLVMDIRAKSGITITVKTTLTVGSGSITYDAGASIMKLY